MKRIILNIILVFLLMIHHATAEKNAQSGESDKLESSTNKDLLSYDVPKKLEEADAMYYDEADAHASNKESSFHDRLKDLPDKIITQLLTNGKEIGKGVSNTFQGKFLEGTIQSFRGIADLFKDGFANTRYLIFGED